MNDDPSKRLQLTLWDVQKRWGQKSLDVLNTPSSVGDSTRISTGFAELDQVLGSGGIARGRITELLGIPTSGMTTLAHKLTASAQLEQGTAAYIDLSRTFDPDFAVRCNVSLERLLLVRPENVAQALEIARDLFKEGKLNLVLLDLVSASTASSNRNLGTNLGTMLRRLHEPLVKSGSAAVFLLLAPQPPPWQALDEYTHTRLLVERQTWLYQQRDVSGYRVQVTVLKDKAQPGERQVFLDLTFDDVVKGDGT